MQERPNILWLMTDEQRRDSLGCYGSAWAQTPNLDRLAREGVMFHGAVTPAPVCVPARVSLLSGQYPQRTGVWYNGRFEVRPDYLTEVFREAGYRTASFGKQHYVRWKAAFETEANLVLSEEVHYFHYNEGYAADDYDVVQYPSAERPWIFGGRFPADSSRMSEAQAVEQAMRWLAEQPADLPFLLRISFNGPHTPVVVPAPFSQSIDPDDIHIPSASEGPRKNAPRWLGEVGAWAGAERLNAEQIRQMRRYYYEKVAFLDHQFGRLLDWMEEHGLLENTIIAYVSDHGTHLGDYGLVQKQTFYEPVVTVPFFFWYPQGFARGAKIHTPVEVQSLLPSLLEVAGLSVPDSCQAESLAASLREGEEPMERPVFSEFTLGSFGIRPEDRLVMVREGNWKLTLCVDPEPGDGGLYDLAEDPYERQNLYRQPEYQEVEERLTTLVLDHIES